MGQVLIERWLAGATPLPINDEASVSLARATVRDAGDQLGLPKVVVEALATSASELCHNQLRHARGGGFAVRQIARAGVPGLEIVAVDRGPGIVSPGLSLGSLLPSEKGLGLGLGSVRRLCDEVDIDVRLREGTAVWARKFAAEVTRRREVAVFGRPIDDAPESADDAVFVRGERELLLCVVDGVGHGEEAKAAAEQAITVVVANASRALEDIVEACGRALAGSRGVAGAILRIDEAAASIEHASVGNVETRFFSSTGSRGLAGRSGTIGMPGRQVSPHVARGGLERTELVALYTDGLSRKTATDERRELVGQHPMMAASALFITHAREGDDGLILTAR